MINGILLLDIETGALVASEMTTPGFGLAMLSSSSSATAAATSSSEDTASNFSAFLFGILHNSEAVFGERGEEQEGAEEGQKEEEEERNIVVMPSLRLPAASSSSPVEICLYQTRGCPLVVALVITAGSSSSSSSSGSPYTLAASLRRTFWTNYGEAYRSAQEKGGRGMKKLVKSFKAEMLQCLMVELREEVISRHLSLSNTAAATSLRAFVLMFPIAPAAENDGKQKGDATSSSWNAVSFLSTPASATASIAVRCQRVQSVDDVTMLLADDDGDDAQLSSLRSLLKDGMTPSRRLIAPVQRLRSASTVFLRLSASTAAQGEGEGPFLVAQTREGDGNSEEESCTNLLSRIETAFATSGACSSSPATRSVGTLLRVLLASGKPLALSHE